LCLPVSRSPSGGISTKKFTSLAWVRQSTVAAAQSGTSIRACDLMAWTSGIGKAETEKKPPPFGKKKKKKNRRGHVGRWRSLGGDSSIWPLGESLGRADQAGPADNRAAACRSLSRGLSPLAHPAPRSPAASRGKAPAAMAGRRPVAQGFRRATRLCW